MPFAFICEDITTVAADAIVNAANTQLRAGGGVCGAIFHAAGHAQLQAACDQIGGCQTGQAVITGGFALPAKYIIHAVGPRYDPNVPGQAARLRSCYTNSLALARWYGLRSVAFPLISSGTYGYPKWEALDIAIEAIVSDLMHTGDSMDVFLCLMEPDILPAAETRKLYWKGKIKEKMAKGL